MCSTQALASSRKVADGGRFGDPETWTVPHRVSAMT